MPEAGQKALSVGAALAIAKHQLEGITLRVVGEVSELSNKPGYAAVYFTLKDAEENASLPCLMWMNRFKQAGVDFRVGSVLEVTGRFSLYAAKGRMNFDVASLSLAGEGDLRLRIAALAKRLQAEGLMLPEAKRPLPHLPMRIGLVTSPRGAAVYDVLRTLRRRFPLAQVVVAGVPVEGSHAPAHLIAGLEAVEEAGVDVVLLVRGGGSFEDLMPFNDESLARHIASMSVPVVTGIGHEPDTSIADMVADVRASTPTAAAEAVVPALEEMRSSLVGAAKRMGLSQGAIISRCERRLLGLSQRAPFVDPQSLFRDRALRLDDASKRLEGAIPHSLAQSRATLSRLRLRLLGLAPAFTANRSRTLASLGSVLKGTGGVLLNPFKERVSITAAALEGLSPLAVLARGYAAVFAEDGRVIGSVKGVSEGERIGVRLSDGALECRVEGKRPLEDRGKVLKETM